MWSQDAHKNENQHDTYFCGFYAINYLFFLPRVYTCDNAQRSNSDIVKEKLFSPSVLYLTIYKLGITGQLMKVNPKFLQNISNHPIQRKS
jgi:hypothetical protein